jgi:hypothetical protein
MSNTTNRKKQLNRLKKASPVQLKELWFLLRMDSAYLSDNLSPAELSMLIIRFSEENNIEPSLEQEMLDLKITTDTDSDIINSQTKNNMNKFIREENIEFLADPQSFRSPISNVNPTPLLTGSSNVDRNCMFKFLRTSKLEDLRGLDICDLVTVLKDENVYIVSCFLCHTISFLDMSQQRYFQLLNTLRDLKPYPE